MREILNIEQIKMIAIEYGRTKGPEELAKEFGVSRQRIQQVATTLRKMGVGIPRMREAKYKLIINELKKEHPELFKQETVLKTITQFIKEKNPDAVALGRLGGKKGGKARAESLSPERRKEIAKKGAEARWNKEINYKDMA